MWPNSYGQKDANHEVNIEKVIVLKLRKIAII
jgi:hypothetical protein